ncbi:hypothetical protein DRQ33_08500 [bacterium]|nr:MAG: hypothetical protein DRQ33_08500 [bacterium]
MGDPAMELAYPYNDISIEIEPDTILPGSWLVVSGMTDESVNGEILLFLQEPLITKYYYSSYIDSECYYKCPGKILFAGAASVNDGNFELSMFVPQHLAADSGFKIIGYAYADDNCYNASGALTDIPANRSVSSDVNDTTGPVIKFHFDMDDFQNGGVVCSHGGSLYVAIELFDEHGIDMGSTPGHGILLQLDDEFHQADVSQNLSYAIDDPTSAQTHYVFSDVLYGGHTICVQAWDNLGNPSQACIDIELEDCSANIYNILPYPNPFNDGVDITFSLAGTGATADVTLQIFSIGGRKIFSKSKTTSAQFDWIHWDGCAPNGESVARGVYIYVIQAALNAADGQKTKKTQRGKIVKR